MLQELAAQTGAGVWVIASMIFFLVAWIGIAVWVVRIRPEVLKARARLALEGENEDGQEAGSTVGHADEPLTRGNHGRVR